jgi:hypothetical protein
MFTFNYLCTDKSSSSELVAKGSAHLTETLKDPATAFLYDSNQSAFCRAVGTNKNAFKWLEEPENELRRRRFGVSMQAPLANSEGVLDGVCHTLPQPR